MEDNEKIKTKEKALVTGGAGFIGSWVVDKLIEKNYEVVVIDNLSTGSKDNLDLNNENIIFYEEDIKNKDEIEKIFKKEKPDYVFHLAAQINVRESIKNPEEDARTNILGSLNILNNCVRHGVRKIIFSSTGGAIYGDDVKIPTPETAKEKPMSPYGIAKLTIENYLEFYKNVSGLNYAVLRYSNVYGPRQNAKGEAGVVAIFIEKLLLQDENQKPIINGSGEQTRDYVYVSDVADANILALEKNLFGIYNVGTGKETSVNEIFQKFIKILGLQNKIKEIHGPAVKGEQMRSCLDYSKLQEKGWAVNYDLNNGLKETADYFKNKNIHN